MQQTTKYKFNIIESGDTFSPDALNANARTTETELARVETETTAQLTALVNVDAALAQADKTNKTALEQALTSQKTALEQAMASQKNALEKTIASQKTTLEQAMASQKTALEQSIASTKSTLQTAIGTAGKTCRIATGSYVGNGSSNGANCPSVTTDFKPLVLFVGPVDNTGYGSVMFRNCAGGISNYYSQLHVTWEDRKVSWYTGNAADTLNILGAKYYYVVIGESL